jgi:hypothetical protein
LNEILFAACIAVSSLTINLLSFSTHAHYIILAAKFTESPITEYSLLLPLVPTTPENTNPVAIPIEIFTGGFLLFNSLISENPHNVALTGSSYIFIIIIIILILFINQYVIFCLLFYLMSHRRKTENSNKS